jgi:hypothetical protein
MLLFLQYNASLYFSVDVVHCLIFSAFLYDFLYLYTFKLQVLPGVMIMHVVAVQTYRPQTQDYPSHFNGHWVTSHNHNNLLWHQQRRIRHRWRHWRVHTSQTTLKSCRRRPLTNLDVDGRTQPWLWRCPRTSLQVELPISFSARIKVQSSKTSLCTACTVKAEEAVQAAHYMRCNESHVQFKSRI